MEKWGEKTVKLSCHLNLRLTTCQCSPRPSACLVDLLHYVVEWIVNCQAFSQSESIHVPSLKNSRWQVIFLYRRVVDPSLTVGWLQVEVTLVREYMALRIDQDSRASQWDHGLPGLQVDHEYVFPPRMSSLFSAYSL